MKPSSTQYSGVTRREVLLGGIAIGTLSIAHHPWARASSSMWIKHLPDAESAGQQVWQVDRAGYIAEDYLLGGKAPLYEPVTSADSRAGVTRDETTDRSRRTFNLTRIGPDAPYVTRVLVYRPRDPERFSGNVILESFHPADGGSMLIMKKLNRFVMRNGDVLVGVQHQQTLEHLTRLDPSRYGDLEVAHGSQLWGMLRDTGARLRTTGNDNLLGGLRLRHLFMSGHSHTGNVTAAFANFHHADARLPDGKHIFDGYLPLGTATYVRTLDVPVIRINVQSDFAARNGIGNRALDEPGRNLHRLYEIPGPAHVNAPIWKKTNEAEPPLRGQPAPTWYEREDRCLESFGEGTHKNDFPTHIAYAAAFRNMYDWVDRSIEPPPSKLIATDPDGETLLDELGNARGGLRLPHIDVPIAQYGVGDNDDCRPFGYTRPFDIAMLKRLYGDRARWAAKFNEATESAIAAKTLLREDTEEIDAFMATVPPF